MIFRQPTQKKHGSHGIPATWKEQKSARRLENSAVLVENSKRLATLAAPNLGCGSGKLLKIHIFIFTFSTRLALTLQANVRSHRQRRNV